VIRTSYQSSPRQHPQPARRPLPRNWQPPAGVHASVTGLLAKTSLLLATNVRKLTCDRPIGASSNCWPCRMLCGRRVRSGWRLMRAMMRSGCTSFVGSDGG
jgi:hypothetical protein